MCWGPTSCGRLSTFVRFKDDTCVLQQPDGGGGGEGRLCGRDKNTGMFLAIKQRIPSSPIPPCHRHMVMVMATALSVHCFALLFLACSWWVKAKKAKQRKHMCTLRTKARFVCTRSTFINLAGFLSGVGRLVRCKWDPQRPYLVKQSSPASAVVELYSAMSCFPHVRPGLPTKRQPQTAVNDDIVHEYLHAPTTNTSILWL